MEHLRDGIIMPCFISFVLRAEHEELAVGCLKM